MLSQDSKIGAISTFLQRLDRLAKGTNKQLYFRGHSKCSYQLTPSIYRNRGWIENESTMLKEVILRCPDDFTGGISTFQSLVRMQHYGLPTRLLDITSNPLVALYFACQVHKDDDEDAEVIALGFDVGQVKYFDSDTVSVIANLSRRPSSFAVPNAAEIGPFNDCDEIKLLLHDVRQDRPHFDPKIRRDDLMRVICVRPRLENPRIIRQEGAFLLFGCVGQKNRPAELPVPAVLSRLIINRNEKQDLLDQLETLGISRATLFPEIDEVASYVRDLHFVPTVNRRELSQKQREVFDLLRKSGELTIPDLAAKFDIEASAASRIVRELANQRFVEIAGSGRDRRWRIARQLDVVDEDDSSPMRTAEGALGWPQS